MSTLAKLREKLAKEEATKPAAPKAEKTETKTTPTK